MTRLIKDARSVIAAVDLEHFADCEKLALAVRGVPGISGFKLGFQMGLRGLAETVRTIRRTYGNEGVFIYDHQKAANDIPDMGSKFAQRVKEAGCHAAILFPFAGPTTQTAWTKACQDAGLVVLIGAVMTHKQFLVSEGGYISNDAPARIFDLACRDGVTDFVVPGTKLGWVTALRARLEHNLGEGNFDLYAPGFVTQGGDVTECGQAAGPRFHAIVGSAIYGKDTVHTKDQMWEAARQVTSQLMLPA